MKFIFQKNTVNFKMVQMVLHILARQMRLLEQDVEIKFEEMGIEKKEKEGTKDEYQQFSDESFDQAEDAAQRKDEDEGADVRGGGRETRGDKKSKDRDKADRGGSKDRDKADRSGSKERGKSGERGEHGGRGGERGGDRGGQRDGQRDGEQDRERGADRDGDRGGGRGGDRSSDRGGGRGTDRSGTGGGRGGDRSGDRGGKEGKGGDRGGEHGRRGQSGPVSLARLLKIDFSYRFPASIGLIVVSENAERKVLCLITLVNKKKCLFPVLFFCFYLKLTRIFLS